jgi:hypothetical protein
MSVQLTPKRGIFGFTLDRCLTGGLSQPLAEISTAGLLVATGSVRGAPELPAPAAVFLAGISWKGSPSLLLGPEDWFVLYLVPILIPRVLGI